MKRIAVIGQPKEINQLAKGIESVSSEIAIQQSVSFEELNTISISESVDEILILFYREEQFNLRKIILKMLNSRIPIKILPVEANQIVNYENAREIRVEDLFFYPFHNFQKEAFAKVYENKTIVVFGGAGSIGSEIVSQLLNLGVKKVIIYDNTEYFVFKLDQDLREKGILPQKYQIIIGNVLNKDKVYRVLKAEKPDFVFHLAAYKHVYLMEDNIDEAIVNNLDGIRNVIDGCVELNVPHVIFVSTDKVVNPTNVMGATKKLSEIYINQKNKKNTKVNIVRFGNVINSKGSVIPLFKHQIAKKIPLTITDQNVKRFFMSIPQAAFLVLQCQLHETMNNVFILNMGNLVPLQEVALCLIRIHNLIPNIDIPITYIGLKKGEKMEEELWTGEEFDNMEPLNNGRIYKLKKITSYAQDINQIFNELIGFAKAGNSQEELRNYLLKLFPNIQH